MPMTLLAHGALGVWDELIFLAVVVVFLGLMGVSWLQNRNTTPDFEESTAPESEAITEPKAKNSDHFELD